MNSRNLKIRCRIIKYSVALLVLAGVAAFSTGCMPKAPPPAVEKAKKVAVRVLETTLIEDRLTLPGEVVALKSVMLAAEAAGKVEWIKTRADGSEIDGSDVQRGDELLKVDARLAAAQLDQATAGLELANTAYCIQAKLSLELARQGLVQAAAALELANATYKRKAALADMGSASMQDLDKVRTALTRAVSAYDSAQLGLKSAQAGYDTARLRLRQAQAALTSAEIMFEKSVVKAPFSGLVAYVMVEVGDYVNPGAPVARIIVIDKVKLIVQSPEGDFSRIMPELPVAVTIPALESASYNGTVTRIPDMANTVTRTFPVEVTLTNPGRRIKPGMIAKAQFILGRHPEAIVIPTNAIMPVGAEEYLVYVAEKDNAAADSKPLYRARKREVFLGVMEEDRFQITSGLKAGDILIVKGHQGVAEGQELDIVAGLPGMSGADNESSP